MEQDLRGILDSFDKIENDLANCGKDMIQDSDLFQFDLLVSAVLNRSLALMNGFQLLIKNNNYICAAHLVRLHLDSLMRLSAAWLVDDPHELSAKILRGTSLKSIKDRNNKPLSDKYLVNSLLPRYPWIESVYNATCGYVHFSNKHIITSSQIKKDTDRTIEFSISREDRFITDEDRIEASLAMITVSECIIEFVNDWIRTKKNKTAP